MQEYVSDAIVLAKYPSGELDSRYALFTQKYGKMVGKTKSTRKITSKLAGHLEPGNAVKARFVEKGGGSASLAPGTQIVDALKTVGTGIALNDLALLAELLPEMDPDPGLWDAVGRQPFSWRNILGILGWDPGDAACASCGTGLHAKNQISKFYFYIGRQEFFCGTCAAKGRKENMIAI
ncbi:MAG: recombination protein O N-terminal domain-containing protein [Patescibacteria group bacterium]|nr:recombination protein O N-terminal domain-containing protein [Patescibacteria group bacterium]